MNKKVRHTSGDKPKDVIDLIREMEQHLRANGHDGRFQSIANTINEIEAPCADLRTAVNGLERSPRVGGSPLNHHQEMRRYHQFLVVWVSRGRMLTAMHS